MHISRNGGANPDILPPFTAKDQELRQGGSWTGWLEQQCNCCPGLLLAGCLGRTFPLRPCFKAWFLVFKIHTLDFFYELKNAQTLQWYTQANKILYGWWINQKIYVFIFWAALVSFKRPHHPLSCIKERLFLPSTPLCPRVLSKICVWPFHCLACDPSGIPRCSKDWSLDFTTWVTSLSLSRLISSLLIQL